MSEADSAVGEEDGGGNVWAAVAVVAHVVGGRGEGGDGENRVDFKNRRESGLRPTRTSLETE